MYFFQTLYFCCFWWFTQARNLRTSTSLIAYGARGVKNWLFSHWVLYRQMGHLWMEETYRPPFSAFKDSLIAYFILSFFPKRHLWSKAPLHANAFFYDIFEERTLGLSILSLSFCSWKNSCFLSPLPHIFGAWKGHWNATIFQGDNCHISVLGTRGWAAFARFYLHKGREFQKKSERGDSYNCRIVVIVVPSKRKNFQVFLGDSTLEWAFKFLVHFWQWTIDFSHQKW